MFLQRLNLEGRETNNQDGDIIDDIFDRAGAYVMGKRMFENMESENLSLEIIKAVNFPLVTHLQYKVLNHHKN